MDLTCITNRAIGNFEDMVGTYVDKTIATGKTNFEKRSRLTECMFECKECKFDSQIFAGIEIKNTGSTFLVHQTNYASKLLSLSLECTFERFRALLHAIAWLMHTRPDLCSAVTVLSKVTKEKFERKIIELVKNIVDSVKYKGVFGSTNWTGKH